MDTNVARIIDANSTRAGEALRVMEDYARFALDDAQLTRRLKQLRHDLTAALAGLPADELLAARDTPGDTGTTISTDAELSRATAAEVCTAACQRLSQALRCLAEYAKTARPAVAQALEQLRYEAYDLQAPLTLRSELRRRFADVSLYVLITAELCRGDWLETAAAAVDGGADCLQLREKHLPDGRLLRRASALVELAHGKNVLCIINDRPDIARICGADGVHLGQQDLSVNDARSIVGGHLLVGKSAHSETEVAQAAGEKPDYLAIGPMFASQTKPQVERSGSRSQLIENATVTFAGPLVPIGGITAENVGELVSAGLSRAAVCGAVIGAADPEAAAAAIKRGLGRR